MYQTKKTMSDLLVQDSVMIPTANNTVTKSIIAPISTKRCPTGILGPPTFVEDLSKCEENRAARCARISLSSWQQLQLILRQVPQKGIHDSRLAIDEYKMIEGCRRSIVSKAAHPLLPENPLLCGC